ncbi:MAG: 30S ribosomal protein S11 [Candidatus Pacebacteria bacterium]|nr:30S ribosomal protein S11 [Candidatus Paceibacterota bacterium]
MGKVRIVKKNSTNEKGSSKTSAKVSKKKVVAGTIYIEATFNNTKAVLTDKSGNALIWSSAGSLGFRGAKKGTPFAASKVGDTLAEKAEAMGLKEVDAVIRGVGSGREPVIRSFIAKGYELTGIRDETPIPHNGPKAKKARRV